MATLYTRVRSRGGTLYTVTNTVKNAADSPFVVSANVRAADGTTTHEIFTETVGTTVSTLSNHVHDTSKSASHAHDTSKSASHSHDCTIR